MGLIKFAAAQHATVQAEPKPEDMADLLAGLVAPEAAMRRRAARALGGHPASIGELTAALAGEAEPPVQQELIGALVKIGTSDAVAALVGLLRAEPAWLRNAALEALQSIGAGAVDAVCVQLGDADPCTRISAVVTLSGLPAGQAEAALIAMLDSESEVNVLAAIVEALDQVGSAAAAPALDRFVQDAAVDPFLAFAAGAVQARLVSGAS